MNQNNNEQTQSKPNYTAEFDGESRVWADLTISKKGFRITTSDKRIFMTSVQHIKNLLSGNEHDVYLNELVPKGGRK